jgi:hypothetical protein
MRNHGWSLKDTVYCYFIPPANVPIKVYTRSTYMYIATKREKNNKYGSERSIQPPEEEEEKKKVMVQDDGRRQIILASILCAYTLDILYHVSVVRLEKYLLFTYSLHFV